MTKVNLLSILFALTYLSAFAQEISIIDQRFGYKIELDQSAYEQISSTLKKTDWDRMQLGVMISEFTSSPFEGVAYEALVDCLTTQPDSFIKDMTEERAVTILLHPKPVLDAISILTKASGSTNTYRNTFVAFYAPHGVGEMKVKVGTSPYFCEINQ
ncbi:MAG: hypothetical protein R2824_34945 [Saprospiraceae bacterium]|nr:hypothetical protein [Lewinella sp.]